MRINLKNPESAPKANFSKKATSEQLEESRQSSFQINLIQDKEKIEEDISQKVVLAIIGVTRREKIVVLVEYKNSSCRLHIPAKAVNITSNLSEAAREVFFRTTGYDGQMHQVAKEPVKTSSGQLVYTFAAANCQKSQELTVNSRSGIEVKEVTVGEFLENVASGTTENIGSAFMALDYLGMLES